MIARIYSHLSKSFAAATLVLASACLADTAKSKSYVGIVVAEVTTHNYDGKYGVLIEGIAPNSPAAKAKLRNGDIIVSFNKVRITSREALKNETRKAKLGSCIILGLLRNQVHIELELISSKRPQRSSDKSASQQIDQVNTISATDISEENYKLIEECTTLIKNQLTQIQGDINILGILKAMQDIRNSARDNVKTRDKWMAGYATVAIMQFKDNEGFIILYGSNNILTLRVEDLNSNVILNIKINEKSNRDKIPESIIARLKQLK